MSITTLECLPELAALEPIEIRNLATSEIVSLGPEITIEQAYHLAINVKTASQALMAYGRALEAAISRHMEEEQATERVVDGVLYALKADPEWIVDSESMVATLQQLVEINVITEKEYGEIVSYPPVPAPKVNNTKLNGILKRGQTVAEAISKHRHQVFGLPKLSIKRVVV